MLSSPRKPPSKMLFPLVEHALEEPPVAASGQPAIDAEDTQRRPGMDRRVHVAEIPLVGGQLPVRVQIPLAQQQHQLLFRELGVDERQRNAVEPEIPRGVPRVLPLVRHRNHVGVVEVRPLVIPALEAFRRRGRLARIAVQPLADDVVVILLAPQQPRERLSHHVLAVVAQRGRDDVRVELVGFGDPIVEDLGVRVRERGGDEGVGQPQMEHRAAARGDERAIPRGALRPGARRVDCGRLAADDVLVDAVLDIGRRVRGMEEPLGVRLVVREQQLRNAVAIQVTATVLFLVEDDRLVALDGVAARRGGAGGARPPRPPVPEPDRRQHVELGGVRSAVLDGDPDENVLHGGLRVFDEDVEVPIAVKDARVEQLELGHVAPAARVLVGQARIRERRLWILVEPLHVGVGRRAVEVEVVLLDVLAVIALGAGQAEQAFLEDRVASVPQRDGEADDLVTVADAREPVLVPAVRPGAGVLVREVVPGVAVGAVVLAHGAPRALAEVRSPALPVRVALGRVAEPSGFGAHDRGSARHAS